MDDVIIIYCYCILSHRLHIRIYLDFADKDMRKTLTYLFTVSYQYIMKPEDQWSCKRSPDICAMYKHKTYKTWIKMAEQTLTLITHNSSFTHSAYYTNLIPGHMTQLFSKNQ